MKIECDKCAAKYSIADEKVRGKTFKIRCKKCSNVIIVRDKGAAADGGADDAGADQGAPGWHLAINGETVGPLAEDDVRARFSAGEIDKDTAVWQEGFEDWIPLGDVPTFDDLPDGGVGGVGGYDDSYGQEDDDPFANANQEDYAAGAAAAASAAVAAAAPEPAASPRVTALTGQRNENSVLFSLDSLQALATNNNSNSQPKPSAGSNQQVGTKGLATAAPGSEGSGLIDIRALGSMVGSDQPVTASAVPAAADDAALPSFGGSGLGGLAAAPLVASPMPEPAAAAAAAAPPPPQRSNAPIYILMVLLILALGGLAAYILLKPEQQPQVIVKEVPGAAPSVADKDDKDEDDDEDKKKKDDEDEDEDKDDEEDEGGDAEGDDAAAEEDKSGGKKSSGKKSSGKKSTGSSKKSDDDPMQGFGDPTPKSSGSSKPTSSAPAKKEDVSVDCILDPSKCKKGGSSKPSGSSSSSKPAATDASLPATLTSSDIRAGVAPFKSAAKACGGKHGAAPGTKVKIKLSITGATGTVASASPEAPHNGTPLGNCVAAAVKGAKFNKFQKSQLGAVYPFTM